MPGKAVRDASDLRRSPWTHDSPTLSPTTNWIAAARSSEISVKGGAASAAVLLLQYSLASTRLAWKCAKDASSPAAIEASKFLSTFPLGSKGSRPASGNRRMMRGSAAGGMRSPRRRRLRLRPSSAQFKQAQMDGGFAALASTTAHARPGHASRM
eukprot:scaffold128_cov248-Pinguiococcus_pyrenoidosus.AAC.42